MKRTSSFFFARWWNGLDLQTRLFVAFTALFVYCILALSVFLYMSLRLVEINKNARVVFEQTRSVYQLRSLSKQYELALNQYEISGSYQALIELNAFRSRIDDTVIVLDARLKGTDAQDLATFVQLQDQISEQFDQIVAKVDAEDWAAVEMLDEETLLLFESLYLAIDKINTRGWDQLYELDDEKNGFTFTLSLSLWIGVPLFLLLAGIVTLVIHAQINQPLEQIAHAAKDLLAGKFIPAQLEQLVERSDEIGLLAGEFIKSSVMVDQRTAHLSQEAVEIKGKIR